MKKRIALSAVAALAGGLLVAAPASAATLSGKVVATASATALSKATVEAATASTIAAPATFTAIGGSTVTLTADMDAYATVTATSGTNADFATGQSALTVTSTALENDEAKVVFTAPAADGVYYVKLTSTGNAYLKLTVVDMQATLGDGLNAAGGTATVASAGSATVNGVAGPANTVTVTTVKNAALGAKGLVTVSGASATIATGGTVAADYLSTTVAADGLGTQAVVVKTPAAGTVTVNFYEESTAGSGIFSTTAASTVTITVNAAAVTNVYASSTAYMTTTTGAAATADTDAAAVATVPVVSAAAAATAPVARFDIKQYSSTPALLDTAYTQAVTVEITGAGALGDANNQSTGTYLAFAAASQNSQDVFVYADGRTGTGTVVVKVNGVVVTTRTITFYGTVASYTLTVKNAVLSVGSNADNQVLVVKALDAAGVAVPGATVYVSSGSTAVATVDAITETTSSTADSTFGTADIGVNAVAKGAAVITVANAATAATVSATATINVVTAGISSVTLAFDKAEYAPGEKATLTVTAKNADGVLVGDEEFDNFFKEGTGISTSVAVGGDSLTSDIVATTNGVKTYSIYMPLAVGPVTASALLGSHSAFSAAIEGLDVAVSASAKVVAPVDATVTAINAKVQSTEATVAALQVTVASVIKSLKVQWWLLKKIAVKVGIKLG